MILIARHLRTYRIEVISAKLDWVNFGDPDWPGLVNRFSATLRGQLNWAGPIAIGSKHVFASMDTKHHRFETLADATESIFMKSLSISAWPHHAKATHMHLFSHFSLKIKGGGKSGEWKTYHKTPPPKRFSTPPPQTYLFPTPQNRTICFPPPLWFPEFARARKPININILGWILFGTNRNHPWDKHDLFLGQTGTRPWDKAAVFCLIPHWIHSEIAILSRLSLGRVGVLPWADCPARAVRKMFMWFLFMVFFFSPPNSVWVVVKQTPSSMDKCWEFGFVHACWRCMPSSVLQFCCGLTTYIRFLHLTHVLFTFCSRHVFRWGFEMACHQHIYQLCGRFSSGNVDGVQKSMGHKVPWKTGILIYLPVTSRPLIFLQKEAVLALCNFANTNLTACIQISCLPLTYWPMKRRTLSQRPIQAGMHITFT